MSRAGSVDRGIGRGDFKGTPGGASPQQIRRYGIGIANRIEGQKPRGLAYATSQAIRDLAHKISVALQQIADIIGPLQQGVESAVKGPASSTDNAIPLWDGATGSYLQDSPHTITGGGGQTVLTVYVEGTQVIEFGRMRFQQYEDGAFSQMTATGSSTTGNLEIAPNEGDVTFSFFEDASDNAEFIVKTADTAADAFAHFEVDGVEDWSLGIDNSDGDSFKVSDNGALGTNDRLVIDTSGYVIVNVPESAPADAALANGQVAMWYDSSGPSLTFKHKDSGGTVRSGTVALS